MDVHSKNIKIDKIVHRERGVRPPETKTPKCPLTTICPSKCSVCKEKPFLYLLTMITQRGFIQFMSNFHNINLSIIIFMRCNLVSIGHFINKLLNCKKCIAFSKAAKKYCQDYINTPTDHLERHNREACLVSV